jgi:phosphoribulokinase
MEEVDLVIDLSQIMRISEHEFSIEFQRDDYYGKRVGVMTIDGEVHQSTIEGLEAKLCQLLGTTKPVADRQDSYVNATGLAQLILGWRCLEKLAYLIKGYRPETPCKT